MGQRQKALDRILPLLTTSQPDAASSVTELRAGGASLTDSGRAELLAKALAGELVEVELDVLAYEQNAQPNRKFVRFRDGLMSKLAASGKGTPVLRDHEQGDMRAKGGTVISSRVEKRGDGDYAIMQTHRLTAPWAVELAARGLLDRVSIGWNPTGPITCSACGTEVFTECYHLPGDRVAEDGARASGGKRFVRKADGPIMVQWVFTDAELIETSHVPIPAVKGAGVEQIRATLSLDFPEIAETAPPPAEPEPEASSLASQVDPQQEPDMTGPTLAPQTPAPEPGPQVDPAEVQRLASAQVAAKLADVATLRSFAERVKFDSNRAQELVLAHPTLDAAKAAMLTELASKAPAISSAHSGGLMAGEDERDKRREVLSAVLLDRMILSAARPGRDLKRPEISGELASAYRRKTLINIAEDYLSARGVSTSHMDPRDIAEHVLSSSSDFPLLLADVGNKFLIPAFESRPSPWMNFSREIPAKDFKPSKLLRRGSAPKVKRIPENGAVKFETFGERQETMELETFGVGTIFTRQMLINDDLGAFATQALGLNDSVMDNRDDVMISEIIVGNPVMSDNKELFHADHNNIVSITGSPSVDTIDAAEDLMSLQVEILENGDERKLNIVLDSWLGARKEAMQLDKLVNPRFVPTTAGNAVGSQSLGRPVYWDNRLAVNDRYFYGICAARTGLVHSFLQGSAQPKFSQAVEFATQGVKLMILDDFAGGLDSWEWIVRVEV